MTPPRTPRGPTIPFVGLTEAYVLASFRQAGVPMQRIRPAVRRLEEEMGLAQALASERLRTDGAEVLWDYGQRSDDQAEKDAVGDLRTTGLKTSCPLRTTTSHSDAAPGEGGMTTVNLTS